MIKFLNICKETPYLNFKKKYDVAIEHGQEFIEAMSIASYNKKNEEVDLRFVNLKFVDNYDFIFFTNYNSPKSIAFQSHQQISACFFWSKINTQIRMKANIKKTSHSYNNNYFKTRSFDKNALAISSNQSSHISSYDDVNNKYSDVFANRDLSVCPPYWGGYKFTPYEIEFWEGQKSRINKRDSFIKENDTWMHYILEP